MSSKIERLEKFANSWSVWLNWVAGAGLVTMLTLIIADIIGVKIFNSPVPGAIEFVAFMGVVVSAFAIAHTHLLRGHIRVEFVVMHLPKQAQAGVNAFVSLLGMALFAILAWRSYILARVLQTTGEVSMTYSIPFYPFVHAIAFCCLSLCLVLLVEFLRSVRKAVV